MPTVLLGLGATVAILIGWRADVVRLMPQTASLYSTIGLGVNLRGVVFENIKTSREIHEGVPVMVVEGEIVSVSRKAVEVLAFASVCATALAPKSITGPRCRAARSRKGESGWHSARGSPRRPPKRTTSA